MTENGEAVSPCCRGSIGCFPDKDGVRASSGAMPPTIVVFVEGGVVQSIEGNAPVRVILCDFDVTEGPHEVGGRPCHIGVWDSPEEPSDAFGEVLGLVARKEHEAGESSE